MTEVAAATAMDVTAAAAVSVGPAAPAMVSSLDGSSLVWEWFSPATVQAAAGGACTFGNMVVSFMHQMAL